MSNYNLKLTPKEKTFEAPKVVCVKCGNTKEREDNPIREVEIHLLNSVVSAVLPDHHNKRTLFELYDLQDKIDNIKDEVEIEIDEVDVDFITKGWEKFNGVNAEGNMKAHPWWHIHCRSLIKQIFNKFAGQEIK